MELSNEGKHERFVAAESDFNAQQQAGSEKLADEISCLGSVEQKEIRDGHAALCAERESLRTAQAALESERAGLPGSNDCPGHHRQEEHLTVREAELRGGLVWQSVSCRLQSCVGRCLIWKY